MNGNIEQLNGNAAFHQRCLAYTQNNPGTSYADAARILAGKDARLAKVKTSLRKAAATK
jgi:hypothetical protein